MDTLLAAFSFVAYVLIGLATKSYYKTYRWDNCLPEEPIIIGMVWPVYWSWRIISWPFRWVSYFFDKTLLTLKNKSE